MIPRAKASTAELGQSRQGQGCHTNLADLFQRWPSKNWLEHDTILLDYCSSCPHGHVDRKDLKRTCVFSRSAAGLCLLSQHSVTGPNKYWAHFALSDEQKGLADDPWSHWGEYISPPD